MCQTVPECVRREWFISILVHARNTFLYFMSHWVGTGEWLFSLSAKVHSLRRRRMQIAHIVRTISHLIHSTI
jgi:hypothetical protein